MRGDKDGLDEEYPKGFRRCFNAEFVGPLSSHILPKLNYVN
jgi:hypothetical protein